MPSLIKFTLVGFLLLGIGKSANIEPRSVSLRSFIFSPGSEDVCICTLEYRPFCGSDGKTYSNLCDLTCTMLQSSGLYAQCAGPCPCGPSNENTISSDQLYSKLELQNETPVAVTEKDNNITSEDREACFCTRMLEPVCGSNNLTYANECMLICDRQQTNNADLVKVGDGKCPVQ